MTVNDPKLKKQLETLAREIAGVKKTVSDISRASQTAYQSLQGSYNIYDENGVLRQVVGQQADGSYTVGHYNTDPPYTPTAPALEELPGLLQVTWDGGNAEGYAWKADFAYVEVHISTTSGFTPTDATEVAVFASVKGGVAAFALDSNLTYYVKLQAVNLEGVEGTPSVESTGSPQAPVTSGGATTYTSTTAPIGASTGDIWYDTSDNNHMYRWDGAQWVSVRDGTIALAQSDATQALSDAAAAQASADGKITSFYQTTPPASGMSDGDFWLDTDDGNKLYIYTSGAWTLAQDADIQAALTAAGDAQATADGKIVTYAQATAPTAAAVGDLWVETDNGNKLYRWDGASWVSVQDAGIAQASADAAQAISDAATAQSTADGKITTFYQAAQPTADGIGDLWVETDNGNKLWRWNGSAWVDVQDAAIQQALSNAATAQTTADGKITAFYQATAPASGMDTGDIWYETDNGNKPYYYNGTSWVALTYGLAALAAEVTARNLGSITTYYSDTQPASGMVAGDLWIDTNDGNKLYRYSGSVWSVAQDSGIQSALTAAGDAQATADGKIVTFAQPTQPTATAVGDLWIETDNNNKLWRWSGSAWVDARDGTIAQAQSDATQALNDAATAISNAATAQSTADGKIVTFIQATQPTAVAVGDLWIDSSDANKLYRWSGSSWTLVRDSGISQAITDASLAQATADGKITAFYQATPPTAEGVGDLWFETDNQNKAYYWDGAAWTALPLGPSALQTIAPATSPTPVVIGGIGALFIRWTPVANESPYKVEVHMSTTSGFTATAGSATTLVASTTGSGATVRNLADGTPLAYVDSSGIPVTYYVKLIALNDVGSAAASAEASGSMVQITSPDIAVDTAWVGTMNVNQLVGGTLDAETILGTGSIAAVGASGARVELSGDGFNVYGTPTSGEEVGPTLVSFPTDGSPNIIAGTLEASTLTVTGDATTGKGATFRRSNTFEQGSSLVLLNQIAGPQSAPTVGYSWDNLYISGIPTVYGNTTQIRGMTYDSNSGLMHTLLLGEFGNDSAVVTFNPTSGGVVTSYFPDNYGWEFIDVCTVGGAFYVLVSAGSSYAEWHIFKYDATWTYISFTQISLTTINCMGICTDGTDLFVTGALRSTGAFRMLKYSTTMTATSTAPTTTYTSSKIFTTDSNKYIAAGTNLGFGAVMGSFDFGAQRVVVCDRGNAKVHTFAISGTTLTEQTNESWDGAGTTPDIVSISHNGTQFISSRYWWTDNLSEAYLDLYTSMTWTTESSKWWLTYTYFDGVYETDESPAASITMKKRARWSITTQASPIQGFTEVYNYSFETGTESWESNSVFGSRTAPTSFVQDATRASVGTYSLKTTWNTGSVSWVNAPVTQTFKAGTRIKITADVYVPTGSPDVAIDIAFVGTSSFTSVKDAWTSITYELTLPSDQAMFAGILANNTTNGQLVWIDNFVITSDGGARIYVGRGATDPGATGHYRQDPMLFGGATSTTRSTIAFTGDTYGANPASAFPNNTPALIKSEQIAADGNPSILIGGDGLVEFDTLLLRGTADASTSAGNIPALRIGDITGTHLRIDGNEILAMAGDATQGTLFLNRGGTTLVASTGTGLFQVGDNGSTHTVIRTGERTGTTDANGEITVTHGLGQTPSYVFLQKTDAQTNMRVLYHKNGADTSTQFTVRMRNSAGSAAASESLTFRWIAFA